MINDALMALFIFEIQIPKETPEHDQLSQRSMSVEMIDSLLKCLKWGSSFGHKINGSRGN
jgi:hypothetical protein